MIELISIEIKGILGIKVKVNSKVSYSLSVLSLILLLLCVQVQVIVMVVGQAMVSGHRATRAFLLFIFYQFPYFITILLFM